MKNFEEVFDGSHKLNDNMTEAAGYILDSKGHRIGKKTFDGRRFRKQEQQYSDGEDFGFK